MRKLLEKLEKRAIPRSAPLTCRARMVYPSLFVVMTLL
jgi:hypothetical protein